MLKKQGNQTPVQDVSSGYEAVPLNFLLKWTTFNLWLGTTFWIEIFLRKRGGKGNVEVQGETVGCLQRIIGKHAKVRQSMCQQHAGIGCLARIEMFKGLGEKRPRSQTCFLRQSSRRVQQKIHQVWKKKRHKRTVFHCQSVWFQNTCWPFSSVAFNRVKKLQENVSFHSSGYRKRAGMIHP